MARTGEHDPFVWPPKRPPRDKSGDAADERSEHSHTPSEKPLSGVVEDSSSSDSLVVPRPTRRWWRDIEETWLGLTTPTFADRASDSGWLPDPPSGYCGRCGRTVREPGQLQEAEKSSAGCLECREKRPKYSRVVRLGEYDELLREVVHEVKFTAWRRLGTELGRTLGAQLTIALARAEIPASRVVLVPMPTTMRRRISRGIDHTTVLSRGVRDVIGAPIVHAVSRRHRPSQTLVPQSQRRENVARTMEMVDGNDLFGKLVVIVDDVMTTGSTMSECARAIREGSQGDKRSPTDIWAAVVAVTAAV